MKRYGGSRASFVYEYYEANLVSLTKQMVNLYASDDFNIIDLFV